MSRQWGSAAAARPAHQHTALCSRTAEALPFYSTQPRPPIHRTPFLACAPACPPACRAQGVQFMRCLVWEVVRLHHFDSSLVPRIKRHLPVGVEPVLGESEWGAGAGAGLGAGLGMGPIVTRHGFLLHQLACLLIVKCPANPACLPAWLPACRCHGWAPGCCCWASAISRRKRTWRAGCPA